MADANYMYSPYEARRFCQAVEDCRLAWLEEPVHANDPGSLAELRRDTRIPIAAGQMTEEAAAEADTSKITTSKESSAEDREKKKEKKKKKKKEVK